MSSNGSPGGTLSIALIVLASAIAEAWCCARSASHWRGIQFRPSLSR
ncbi:hypothetical protein PQR66_25620 [Paraburkholderia agricolaris]|uniref:Uncharacterized protein n=1 Tax=Paraburkholderia agricolaris TaxID=2152888 RepID=A0ABW8ZV94_9BURK